MGNRGRSVHQTSQHLNCETLRDALRSRRDSGRGDRSAIGSIPWRAVAALYMLLLDHPVDRRGRCRSCRRPAAVLGRRWRRCRVHGEATLWLRQPAEFLRSQLARELGLVSTEPPPGAGDTCEESTDSAVVTDQGGTEVLPAVEPAPGEQGDATSQPPPSAPAARKFPRTVRPDPDDRGTGAPTPMGTQPRRAHRHLTSQGRESATRPRE